jgi:hypothetical protein
MSRKLTKEGLAVLDLEIGKWQKHMSNRETEKYASVEWLQELEQAHRAYRIIQALTGLNIKHTDKLVNGEAKPLDYWNPDGSVKDNK